MMQGRFNSWPLVRRSVLGALLGLLAPVVLCAQTAEFNLDSLDAWRAHLSERLDRDVAQLSAAHEPAPIVLRPLSGQREEAVLPPSASLPDLLAHKDGTWRPAIASILRGQGLPAGLAGVAAVESGFNRFALSPKGARGLWQLMPETARRFGLAVNAARDERIDPVKSTLAAARYLKTLHARFGDWALALAAYNTGEDRVQHALDRLRASDFWTLSRHAALPEETRRYVPAVLAKLERPLTMIPPASVASEAAPIGEPQTASLGDGPGSQAQVVLASTLQDLSASTGSESTARQEGKEF